MSQKPNKASRSIAELEHENSMLRAEIDDLKLKERDTCEYAESTFRAVK